MTDHESEYWEVRLVPEKRTEQDEDATKTIRGEVSVGIPGWVQIKVENWKGLSSTAWNGLTKRVRQVVAAVRGKTEEDKRDREEAREAKRKKDDHRIEMELREQELREQLLRQAANDRTRESKAKCFEAIARALSRLGKDGVEIDLQLRQAFDLMPAIAGDEEEAEDCPHPVGTFSAVADSDSVRVVVDARFSGLGKFCGQAGWHAGARQVWSCAFEL